MLSSPRTLVAVTALTAVLATAAAAQVPLEFKIPEGERTVLNTVKSVQTLTVGPIDVPLESEVQARTRLKAGKPGADGTQRVEEKSERFAIKLSIPGGGVEFDYDKPDAARVDQATFQPVVDGLQVLQGNSYTLVFRNGKIADVEGLDAIIQKLPAASAPLFKDELSPKTIMRDWAQQIASLPGKAVKKGDSWQRTEVIGLGGGQTLTFDTVYEYQGTVEKAGRTLDKVSIVLTGVKYTASAGAFGGLTVADSKLMIEHALGHYLFDREKGEILERILNTRVSGLLTLEVNGMQVGGNVDLTLDMSTTVK